MTMDSMGDSMGDSMRMPHVVVTCMRVRSSVLMGVPVQGSDSRASGVHMACTQGHVNGRKGLQGQHGQEQEDDKPSHRVPMIARPVKKFPAVCPVVKLSVPARRTSSDVDVITVAAAHQGRACTDQRHYSWRPARRRGACHEY